jgi:hypothetical protein
MTQIYEVRHKWAKPYYKGVFCAKMTSMQQNESANMMLKNYVPLGCAMNLFVKHYMRLQHDREKDEEYEEKRTKVVSTEIIESFVCSWLHFSFGLYRNVAIDILCYFAGKTTRLC